MSNLTNQTCEACEVGAPLVSEGDQAKLLAGLDGWEIDNGEVSKLIKKYKRSHPIGPSDLDSPAYKTYKL